jgi:lysyl-tRNA synthetase class I
LLYRVLLGQERGPRLGAFIRLATPIKIAEAINAVLASSATTSSSDSAS